MRYARRRPGNPDDGQWIAKSIQDRRTDAVHFLHPFTHSNGIALLLYPIQFQLKLLFADNRMFRVFFEMQFADDFPLLVVRQEGQQRFPRGTDVKNDRCADIAKRVSPPNS